MSSPLTITIGICGFGTVGQGVWKHLERSRALLETRLGAKLVLARASARDLKKKRPVKSPPPSSPTIRSPSRPIPRSTSSANSWAAPASLAK